MAEETSRVVVDGAAIAPFDPNKKKKKKKKTDRTISEEAGFLVDNSGDAWGSVDGHQEEGNGEESGEDYEYEKLLARALGYNPQLLKGRHRTVMTCPQILKQGPNKTVYVNFMEHSKRINRQPEHVMAFILAEMGTSGSLDGEQRLVVRGSFAPKDVENILLLYINEYVKCNQCKSIDTILSKEERIFILRCQQCAASRSVAPVEAGFVARVGHRKVGT